MRTEPDAPAATRKPVRRRAVETEPEAIPESPRTAVVPTPSFDDPEKEVPWAMDMTVARDAVARLKLAAACGDLPGRASAGASLARYGRAAKSLLDQEIETEPDPVVRVILQETRAGIK